MITLQHLHLKVDKLERKVDYLLYLQSQGGGGGSTSAAALTGTTLASNVVNSSLTSVGTISSGTWNGTTISILKGGTGLTSLGTANQQLRVNAGATALEYFTPSLSSSLFPTTGTGTATGAVIGSLAGNALSVNQSATTLFSINPTTFTNELKGDNGTAYSSIITAANLSGNDVYIKLESNDGTNPLVSLELDAQDGHIHIIAPFDVVSDGNIRPDNDNAHDLGSSSIAWKDIYGRTINLDGSTSGGITISSNSLGSAISSTTLSGTGIVPSMMFTRLTSQFSMSNVNTVQPVFGTSQDVWTLQGSTTYYFEGEYYLNHGNTSHSVGMSFELGGGASVTSISYTAISTPVVPGSVSATQHMATISVATNSAITIAGAFSGHSIKFNGWLSMNAGGTVTPSITYSAAPGGTCTAEIGTSIRFTPVGSNTVISVGNVG